MTRHSLDRRQFMSASTAGLAAGLLPANLRALGANDRIQVGIIGCGGRGNWVLNSLQKLRDRSEVTVSAVCDVWRPAREKMAEKIAKGFGKQPASFARYADLLADGEVDAVVITTPDFAHSPILIAAVEAGKDAYCEKPMANTIEHANAARRAVRDQKRVVQIGTQRRSDGKFAAAAELVRSGTLGKVVEIETAWHDHGPRWQRGHDDVRRDDVDWETYLMYLPDRPFDPRRYRCWHLYEDYTVGPVGLLGSHLIDVAHWMMGEEYPRSAVALGGTYVWAPREQADTIECTWEYPGGYLLRYSTRLGNSSHVPEVKVYGTKGTFDTDTWQAVPDGGGADKLQGKVAVEPQPSVDHVQNWLDCVRSRKDPNAPVEVGHAHSVATIMAFDAWRTGRKQVWDAETATIKEA